jgi:hypothetical protein
MKSLLQETYKLWQDIVLRQNDLRNKCHMKVIAPLFNSQSRHGKVSGVSCDGMHSTRAGACAMLPALLRVQNQTATKAIALTSAIK